MKQLATVVLAILVAAVPVSCQADSQDQDKQSARSASSHVPDPATTSWFDASDLKSAKTINGNDAIIPNPFGQQFTYDLSKAQGNSDLFPVGRLGHKDVPLPNQEDLLFNTTANNGLSWDSLSYGEKLQIHGYDVKATLEGSEQTDTVQPVSHLIQEVGRYWDNNNHQLPDSVSDMEPDWDSHDARADWYQLVKDGFYNHLLSKQGKYFHHATGKLIKINHQNQFLKGGITLREVDTSQVKEHLLSQTVVPDSLQDAPASEWLVVYYRLYGTNEVIMEGFRSWHPDLASALAESVPDDPNNSTNTDTQTGETATGESDGSTASTS